VTNSSWEHMKIRGQSSESTQDNGHILTTEILTILFPLPKPCRIGELLKATRSLAR
jgi:hypothetical protein